LTHFYERHNNGRTFTKDILPYWVAVTICNILTTFKRYNLVETNKIWLWLKLLWSDYVHPMGWNASYSMGHLSKTCVKMHKFRLLGKTLHFSWYNVLWFKTNKPIKYGLIITKAGVFYTVIQTITYYAKY